MPILPPEPDRYPLDLFKDAENPQTAPWWVACVRPRREKCLARLLGGDEIAFYLPLQRRRAGAANASRVASVPLFSGYLFFQGEGRERLRAFETGAIMSLLPVQDQQQLHQELATLSVLQGAEVPLESWDAFQPGDPVRISRGPLKRLEGVVIRRKGCCRLVVRVTALNASVMAEVEAGWLVAARSRSQSNPGFVDGPGVSGIHPGLAGDAAGGASRASPRSPL